MKKLPLGIQSFPEIRSMGLLYVDKTENIINVIENGKYNFLSRPRRFGKSLTLSTIKEMFNGRKELFKGLWAEKNWDWDSTHPVVHFSFSSIGYKELGLEKAIEKRLKEIAADFNVSIKEEGVSQQFKELISKLSEINQAVLLIDEYDKPIIDYLDDIPQAKENQKTLKSFYSVIKDSDPYIRFLLITGVSKFSKVSIFSELNNLTDLTLHPRYSTLTGYTQKELEHYFAEGIDEFAEVLSPSKKELIELVKEWYNGYSWDGKNFLYNPYSILSFFDTGQFRNFWFSTGTPTFLIKLLKGRRFIDLEKTEVDESAFESYDIENLDTVPLLFQTGYLTIKSLGGFGIYCLDYPNREVKESLLRHLIGAFRNDSAAYSTPIVIRLRKAFLENNHERIIEIINGLFKSIPSHIFIKEKEAYYHSVVFLVFQYLGQFIDAEVNTSDGRIDAVVKTETHIYILEFKLDESAGAALEQIRKKDYAEKYKLSGKKITGIGINFSSKTKSVEGWEVEYF
ncbi:MAG TPA: AAA family ATPase [Bacteroidetes bacterium]|nr:AAA family ATPase [Bacteroidota bacterium]